MHRTVDAGWLVFSIGAFLKPYLCIVQEFPTRRTQRVSSALVMGGAIDSSHPGHGQPLTSEAFLVCVHSGPAREALS